MDGGGGPKDPCLLGEFTTTNSLFKEVQLQEAASQAGSMGPKILSLAL